MDVSGRKPTTEAGKYFRNNVWWWRPLANYLQELAPEITSKCTHWDSNDGDGLRAAGSKALAKIVREQIACGATAEYAANYKAACAALPRETCNLCNGTGIRTDVIGEQMGQPTKVITEENHPRHGQVGWCNGCNGIGSTQHWSANYPFSVENVEAFATFLEGCGGFRIY